MEYKRENGIADALSRKGKGEESTTLSTISLPTWKILDEVVQHFKEYLEVFLQRIGK